LLLETIEGAAEASEGAGFTGPAYLKDIQAGIKFFVRNPLDPPDPDLLQQLVFGSEAPDQIVGGTQNDKLFGDGQDFLSGATGIDFLEGNADNDVLTGGAGIDFIDGGTRGLFSGRYQQRWYRRFRDRGPELRH